MSKPKFYRFNYATLPDDESAWDTPLDVSAVLENGAQIDAVNDRIARFVRVELVDTEVPWVFGVRRSRCPEDPNGANVRQATRL